MDAIEKENPSLRDVLPKVFARGNLDPTSLGGLIDLVGNIALDHAKARSADLLGHVFEYFLGEFALAEGKKGGQFYTPRSVVELLVEMLEPYKGRVLDPCCGSGGMFVQSEKFVTGHQGKVNDISIYGQESNQTTWRLARMNLAIRHLDSSQVKWNNEGSFLNDAHKDLKADYVIANPPFNDSDWSGDLLRKDGRWQHGVPPTGNANYAWIQHFLYHLNPGGQAGFVLAKGALTSKSSGEGDIRKALVEARLVDCIVNLPAKLFLNTQIPACLWFIRRGRGEPSPRPYGLPSPSGRGGGGEGYRVRSDEILFIDACNLGHLINRRTREFSADDIAAITSAYHAWRSPVGAGPCACPDDIGQPQTGKPQIGKPQIGQPQIGQPQIGQPRGVAPTYADIPGFCASVGIDRVRELDFVLTPGRYVGLPDDEDDFDFKERFTRLKAEFEAQLKEEAKLNALIAESLARVKI
jgi:type I restriction enzyme M protein